MLANIVNENAPLDSLTALSLLIAFYCALTGIACAVYYRRQLTRSVKNLLLVGVGPVIGAILLLWLLVRSAVDLNDPEASSTGAAWFGFGPPLVIGVGIFLLGRDHAVLAAAARRLLEGAPRRGARSRDRRSRAGRPGHPQPRERQGGPPTTGKAVVLGLDRLPGAGRALDVAVRLAQPGRAAGARARRTTPRWRRGGGEARDAIEEFDAGFTRPAVAAAEAGCTRWCRWSTTRPRRRSSPRRTSTTPR